jgi:hypothetical protein
MSRDVQKLTGKILVDKQKLQRLIPDEDSLLHQPPNESTHRGF